MKPSTTCGADLGVTRERVRQIQEEAMEKLRRMFQHVEPGRPPGKDGGRRLCDQ